MPPLLVLAEFRFSAEGEHQFAPHLERTLSEVRGIEGCLHADVWQQPGRRYLFHTVWTDRTGVDAWVENTFHRSVLMPGFREWCIEGWFSYWGLESDHNRARKCLACGRWTQAQPGWDGRLPDACRQCGQPLPSPDPA
jgi:quinol monooxygenase YgiN